MPPPMPIPRFLLPQQGAIWRSTLRTPATITSVRNASVKSTKKTSKPLVLEKPSGFRPPSHPQRTVKSAPRYSGPIMSPAERKAQDTKRYPKMMPPKGSLMHWFLTSKALHMYLTLAILFTLSGGAFLASFRRSSPFADMLPHWSQLLYHPIAFFRTVGEVIRLDVERTSAEVSERRKQKVEDVAKRAAYRKEHGLDQDQGFGGWTAREDVDMLGPGIPVGKIQVEDSAGLAARRKETDDAPTREATEPRTRQVEPQSKKWFGIW